MSLLGLHHTETMQKASLIKNDPNDWEKYCRNPTYILSLPQCKINVRLLTIKVAEELGTLNVNMLN